MASVHRDLDDLQTFCKRFQSEYLEEIQNNAATLKAKASDVAALFPGNFGSRASTFMEQVADQLSKAATQGEVRIRELERNVKQQEAEKEEIESMLR